MVLSVAATSSNFSLSIAFPPLFPFFSGFCSLSYFGGLEAVVVGIAFLDFFSFICRHCMSIYPSCFCPFF